MSARSVSAFTQVGVARFVPMTTLAYPSSPLAGSALASDRAVDARVRARAKSAARDVGFDAARVVASLGIVWVHATRSVDTESVNGAGVFGTAFFTAAAMFFLVRGLAKDPDRGYVEYTRNRFSRLMLPFIAWSIVYLIFRNVCRAFVTHKPLVIPNLGMVVGGTEMQLWFLPFLFFAGMIFFPILKPATRSDDTRRVVGWSSFWLGAALLALPALHDETTDRARFLTCAYFVPPSLCFGVASGLLVRGMNEFRSSALAAIGVAVTIACMAYICSTGPSIVAKNLAGLAWLAMSLSLRPSAPVRWLARLAPLSFGVYLIHPLVTGVFRSSLLKAGVPNDGIFDITIFALTVPAAFTLAWLLHRDARTRWLAP